MDSEVSLAAALMSDRLLIELSPAVSPDSSSELSTAKELVPLVFMTTPTGPLAIRCWASHWARMVNCARAPPCLCERAPLTAVIDEGVIPLLLNAATPRQTMLVLARIFRSFSN